MKRAHQLFELIVSYDNLLLAAYKAARGKRYRDNVLEFNHRLADNLIELRRELVQDTYRPGAYREFWVYGLKRRKISAAPYRDRVVHHAVCNVVMPILGKAFIDTSYANREGKGTHRAVRLCKRLLQKYQYYLKCDIRQYFPSIDHGILKTVIRRRIGCPQTLDLIDRIIDGSNEQEQAVRYFQGDDLFAPYQRRRGLPIGNLTSQHFADVYLTPLDHYVRERLRIRGYIRYVDDLLLFHDDKRYLWHCKAEMERFLASYRLVIHDAAQPARCTRGVTFLGYRVFPTHVRVKRESLVRATRRLRRRCQAFRERRLSVDAWRSSFFAWRGHAMAADAWNLLQLVQEWL